MDRKNASQNRLEEQLETRRPARRRRRLALLLVAFAATLGGGLPSSAQPAETLEIAAHVGGFVNTFEVDGDRIAVAQADTFKVFDRSGETLTPLGFLIFAGEPSALAVAGGHAWLGTEDRLDLVALEAPTGLAVVGELLAAAPIQGLAASGTLGVLALESAGLAVVDASNPASPAVVATVPITARGVALVGSFAFVATDTGLSVVDLVDPTQPAVVGILASGAQRHIVVREQRAFLFGGFNEGLQIVGIADPTLPTLLGDVGDETVFQLDAQADRVFAAFFDRMEILDASDPASPLELGELPTDFTSALRVLGDRVLLATDGQLRLVDVANPAAPTFVGEPESPSFSADHQQVGDDLVVAADDGIWRYDLSVPESPSLIEFLPAFPNGKRIRQVGDLVYLIDSGGLLRAIDVAAVGGSQQVGSLTVLGAGTPPLAFEAVGDRGYVLGFTDLTILDLANPAAPTVAGTLDLGVLARDLAPLADGSILALALSEFAGGSSLALVDVTNPAAPAISGQTLVVGDSAQAVVAEGDLVHVLTSDFEGRFHVATVDVSDLAQPVVADTASGDGVPIDLALLTDGQVAVSFATGGTLDAKASGVDGSVRVFDAAGSLQEVSSASVVAPTTLSSVPGDPDAAVATLGGDQLPSSLEVLGSKGIYIFTGRPLQIPQISVETISQPSSDCPPEPGEELQIAKFNVCVDKRALWDFETLEFRGRGTGHEANDIERVILRFGANDPVGHYSGDNGEVSFSIGQELGFGECLELALSYELSVEGRLCSQGEETKTFAVEISGADIGATPRGFLEFEKLPIAPLLTAQIEVACVENETRDLWFPKVQKAIDDDRTEEGDTIGVCPGIYEEEVSFETRKEDDGLTLHSKQSAEITFLGREESVECNGQISLGSRVSVAAEGVTVDGFTITGGGDGVFITRRGAKIRNNIIVSNKSDGVAVFGDLNSPLDAVIEMNIIGDLVLENGNVVPRGNGGSGVSIGSSVENDVLKNLISFNCEHGVKLVGSSGFGLQRNELFNNLIRGNGASGVNILSSSKTVLGGAGGKGNVIIENGGDGVEIQGPGAVSNFVLGNRIGVGFLGEARGNMGGGVSISSLADLNQIGSGDAGPSCEGECNVIAGNDGPGILLDNKVPVAQGAEGNEISGNFIGINGNGFDIGGNEVGIRSVGEALVAIGGRGRNLISGNRSHGILLEDEGRGGDLLRGKDFRGIEIRDNFIGTDSSGTAILLGRNGVAVGNRGSGIALSSALAKVEIVGNTISGNNSDGLFPGGGILLKDTPFVPEPTISENRIGTDVSGLVSLGNKGAGIWASSARAATVTGNLISGNPEGVVVESEGDGVFESLVFLLDNLIGLAADKAALLPNGVGVRLDGVERAVLKNNTIKGNSGPGLILEGTSRTRVGKVAVGGESESNIFTENEEGIVVRAVSSEDFIFGNEIIRNRSHGILVEGSMGVGIGSEELDFGNKIVANGTSGVGDGIAVSESQNVRVRLNRISGNTDISIDLDDDGPTLNDESPLTQADDDDGANGLQNFPTVIGSLEDRDLVEVAGDLTTLPGTYQVDVFLGQCPQPVGAEGFVSFLGSVEVEVEQERFAPILESFQLPADLPAVPLGVSATATGSEGTSELSPCSLLFSDAIFSDGFETGDTSGWSTSEP